MFSTSRLLKRSLTFCVMPVGIPPHFRNRFHGRREKTDLPETSSEISLRQRAETGTVRSAPFIRKKSRRQAVHRETKGREQSRENEIRTGAGEKKTRQGFSAADAGTCRTAAGRRQNKVLRS